MLKLSLCRSCRECDFKVQRPLFLKAGSLCRTVSHTHTHTEPRLKNTFFPHPFCRSHESAEACRAWYHSQWLHLLPPWHLLEMRFVWTAHDVSGHSLTGESPEAARTTGWKQRLLSSSVLVSVLISMACPQILRSFILWYWPRTSHLLHFV